jgi:hypothetical protein
MGHMNVEIGAEAALFQEKEYISGIFVAVYSNYIGYPPIGIHVRSGRLSFVKKKVKIVVFYCSCTLYKYWRDWRWKNGNKM